LHRLAGNTLLTSHVLTAGIAPHCRNLTSLSLSDLTLIDAEGFEELFSGKRVARAASVEVEGEGEGAEGEDEVTIVSPEEQASKDASTAKEDLVAASRPPWSRGLHLLNAHRLSHAVTPQSFSALLTHSSHSLVHLNLHSCDSLLGPDITSLAQKAERLEVLDVSFVRSVDDFVVKDLLEGKAGAEGRLKTLFVHGNNRVTSGVPRKVRLSLLSLSLSLFPPSLLFFSFRR
jgi:hypothetical protein